MFVVQACCSPTSGCSVSRLSCIQGFDELSSAVLPVSKCWGLAHYSVYTWGWCSRCPRRMLCCFLALLCYYLCGGVGLRVRVERGNPVVCSTVSHFLRKHEQFQTFTAVHCSPALPAITRGCYIRSTTSHATNARTAVYTEMPQYGVHTYPTTSPVCGRYYSAKQMTLVVLGKESLPELQSTVEETFSPVPNRGDGLKPSLKWIGTVRPFPSDNPLQAYNIVPIKVTLFEPDLCCVSVVWPGIFVRL